MDDIFSININNSTSSKQAITLFDIPSELAGTGNTITTTVPGSATGKRYQVAYGDYTGDPLPSNQVYNVFKDITNNILYVCTNSGIWVLNRVTRVAKLYNTAGGATNGQQLPYNECWRAALDVPNNTLYVATTNGLWQYNITTDTGKVYNKTSGAGSGVQMKNNIVYDLAIENSVVWCAIVQDGGSGLKGGVWSYTVATDTGKMYDQLGGATNGVQCPGVVAGQSPSVVGISVSNNQVWACCINRGMWRYNIATDTGSVYNTGSGAGSGSQIPDNFPTRCISADNVLWVTGSLGIWKYNITTDTGSIINTSTVVNGDALPTNTLTFIYVVGTVLYANSETVGTWRLDIDTNTGSLWNTVKTVTGDTIQTNVHRGCFYDSTNNETYLGNVVTLTGGVWEYAVTSTVTTTIHPISSNDGDTYKEICLENIDSPKRIHHIKIVFRNNQTSQDKNLVTLEYYTSHGALEKKTISLFDYRSPNEPSNVIDVEFKDPIIMGINFKMEYSIEANTSVDMLFDYDEGIEDVEADSEKKNETDETQIAEQKKEQEPSETKKQKIVIDWLLIILIIGTTVFTILNKKKNGKRN